MKSAVTTVVTSADAAGRFPTMSDIEAVKGSFDRAPARMAAAEKLASGIDKVTADAVDAIYRNGSYDQANKDKCSRDIHHYLRLINYCLVTGGTGPLDEWGIAGMREVIRAQRLPTAAYIEAFAHIRDRVCVPRDMDQQAATEFKSLLDYLINALS
ncbi:bleomycin hydrolase [Prochlorococcus sp. MIT 1300]|uniref:bleomycin hydrolase n=1 Tax=Prochlorococcus sp. MIT 1300 TaxID=3096218 RepID=UPI002A74C7D8|nr:bleomycin hydrolase [Prochlorococcus sp. MIT 1300]